MGDTYLRPATYGLPLNESTFNPRCHMLLGNSSHVGTSPRMSVGTLPAGLLWIYAADNVRDNGIGRKLPSS